MMAMLKNKPAFYLIIARGISHQPRSEFPDDPVKKALRSLGEGFGLASKKV
jgi:hypothetical protein